MRNGGAHHYRHLLSDVSGPARAEPRWPGLPIVGDGLRSPVAPEKASKTGQEVTAG